MKVLLAALFFTFPILADFSDIDVLVCGAPGKFSLRVVKTDTGNIVSFVERPGAHPDNKFIDSEAKWDFANHALALDSSIFVFDDALSPKEVSSVRPFTSPSAGQKVPCDLKEPKTYAAILNLGPLRVPGDLINELFGGGFVSVRFLDSKHASGDFNCEYRFLGAARKDCHWNFQDRQVTVQFNIGSQTRTHTFLVDPNVKSLVSGSVTLSQ
jgi:hypothetical protein